MENLFEYNGKLYPEIIKHGNAVKYILPFALEFCKGNGLDIGGFDTWVFPNAKAININIDDEYDAMNLPNEKYDFIFSSHCLEHINRPLSEILTYWKSRLKNDGVLFLYLPHNDMEYWHPNINTKHKHNLFVEDLKMILNQVGYKNIVSSERDLYWSFSIIANN